MEIRDLKGSAANQVGGKGAMDGAERLNPGPPSRDRMSRLGGQVPSLALFYEMKLRNKEGLE